LSESQTWRNQNERRYELERDAAERVLEALTAHLPVVTFGDAPATTLVSTLYFDTADQYYLLRAKSAGSLSAIKVRCREYLPVTDDEERRVLDHAQHCYLERKERTGIIRDKYRIRIAKDELAPILAHTQQLPPGAEVLQNEIGDRELLPAMISMYERRVWGNEGLRITLDERIRYYHPPPQPYEHFQALTPSALGPPDAAGPKRILEVKHAAGQEQAPWLVTLLSELPEATGFSKFIDGMGKLRSSVKREMKLTRPLYKLS
jgi:SPX domain protein involved in polyphosphate accumulation